MPTYEYVCSKCGHEFEKFQSMMDKPLATCPEDLCAKKRWGRGKVSKKISAGAGLIFKGTGFYITDYRSEGYKEAAKKESAAASGSNGSASKTDSKPASASSGDSKPAESKASSASKPAPKTESKPKPAKAG